MSDPVASKSTFLCMYMSNHPDTLVAYVKHFGKVPGNIISAEMKSIDCKGMNLSYSLKTGGVGSVQVRFEPPLIGYNDVKPRLLLMKADAEEALGMLKSPKITSFRLPSSAATTGIPCGLLCAAYLCWSPPQGATLPFMPANITDTVFTLARAITEAIGFQPSMGSAIQLITIIHSLECFYTWYLCRRYVKGTFLTVKYIGATFLVGFPIWVDLKRRVQEKRIESVMKTE